MPNDHDFIDIKNIKCIEANPSGWVSSLFIEYGVLIGYIPIVYWRVKGTKHTFTIPMQRLDFLSSGNYKKHFEKTLELFRDDYIEWSKQSFVLDWMKEYEQQFNKFILF